MEGNAEKVATILGLTARSPVGYFLKVKRKFIFFLQHGIY